MTTVSLELPRKFGFLVRDRARYKVVHGGRGGAKSWSFARVLIAKAAESKLRILCARELQVSIKDSVHELLKNQIEELGYTDRFIVQNNSIRSITGSEFIFMGLRHNIKNVKSKEGIDIVWVEEADTVSEESWKDLIPTIRKDDSEIWVSFNPDQATDPTYKRFITDTPPDSIVVEANWDANPFFPKALKAEKDYLYSVDPESAEHVWGGKTKTLSKALILSGKYIVEPFEVGKDWNGPYQGADWGFANDPTALVRMWIHEQRLYIEHEAYAVGIEITDTPDFFSERIPDAAKYVTRADSSRPETISHMRKNGYPRMIAAKKGPGSVEDGIAHLRGYKQIVIHPRCKNAKTTAGLWKWKTDRLTGDILPAPIKKHDHIWDSARYGLEPIIRKSSKDKRIIII